MTAGQLLKQGDIATNTQRIPGNEKEREHFTEEK